MMRLLRTAGRKRCSKGIVDHELSVSNVIELKVESMRSKTVVQQSIMSSCFSCSTSVRANVLQSDRYCGSLMIFTVSGLG